MNDKITNKELEEIMNIINKLGGTDISPKAIGICIDEGFLTQEIDFEWYFLAKTLFDVIRNKNIHILDKALYYRKNLEEIKKIVADSQLFV